MHSRHAFILLLGAVHKTYVTLKGERGGGGGGGGGGGISQCDDVYIRHTSVCDNV